MSTVTSKYEGKSDEEIRQMVVDAFGPEFRKEEDEVRAELRSESPRASVLVGAAWLDDYLCQLLTLTLPQDVTVQSVFLANTRSLGQRIVAAHQLGIIAKTEKEAMDLIRQIRNRFAHRTSVSFDDQDVAALAARLHRYLPARFSSDSDPADQGRSNYVAMVSYYVASLASRTNCARSLNDPAMRLDLLRFVARRVDELTAN
jgi:hypothetical protein